MKMQLFDLGCPGTLKNAIRIEFKFLCDFDAILPPKMGSLGLPFSTFLWTWGAIHIDPGDLFAGCSSQWLPKSPKAAPRTPPGSPGTPPELPRDLPGSPNDLPGLPLEAPKPPKWSPWAPQVPPRGATETPRTPQGSPRDPLWPFLLN